MITPSGGAAPSTASWILRRYRGVAVVGFLQNNTGMGVGVPRRLRRERLPTNISNFGQLSNHFPSGGASFANITVDWKKTPKAHVFKADGPGLKKEELKVEVEDDRMVQISGESCEQEEKGDTWHCVERSNGKFMRMFSLPKNVKVDREKAVMENGVLTVTVPKEVVKKPDG
ncbi:hypothetical protein AgCh_009474 [Apium graveolens]